MRKETIYTALIRKFRSGRLYLAGILITLVFETTISLLLPSFMSKIIDGLSKHTMTWLASLTMLFLIAVLANGFFNVLNALLSEKAGRRACDELRKDGFSRIYHFSIAHHKSAKTGDFLEKTEGDINILAGFFSNMLIDIISSSFLVFGILIVFTRKSVYLGLIFCFLSILIFSIFIGTQKKISLLWKSARDSGTEVFGEFTQIIRSAVDLIGLKKENYASNRFKEKFDQFEQKQVRASFIGNIPATIFFSLLNVGEGIALLIGIYLLRKNELTIGDVYLLLSYVGLLNTPFFHLKYQFTQLPMTLSAFSRLNLIYGAEEIDDQTGTLCNFADESIKFNSVTFGYDDSNIVLKDVTFNISPHDRVLIEGRTGGGKSTILHLIAGFYKPISGNIIIGQNPIHEYQRDSYNENVYYISQFYPIVEDTLRNNLTRFNEKYKEQTIVAAIKKVHLDLWMSKKGIGLNSLVCPADFTKDEIQLLAWAGAVIASPRILLVDEFDAAISDDTIKIADQLIHTLFIDSTIIIVSHKNRSSINFHKKIYMEDGRIEVKNEANI